jgi:anion-transporting  ArsA/GET3 family ATPase
VLRSLTGRRVVVCCGSGGVGKTTVSAALGLGLAARGARVDVVTIDPARRLATALAIEDLGDEARRVPTERAPGGLRVEGELWALQLDPKATFDRLVGRHAPTEEARDRILANRVYKHLSGAVAGAQEYMAVERLHELVDEHRFDCVVLDTPPARNALDFLDAPQRITRFIEGRALRVLLRPGMKAGRIGWRALHAGGAMAVSVLERLTGAQLLRDVSDFLAAFDGMYGGFRDRAQAVTALLRSPRSSFIVVSGPDAEPSREAVALWRRLEHDGYPIGGLVVNRVHRMPPAPAPPRGALSRALARAGADAPEDLAGRMRATLDEARIVALRDLDAVEGLTESLGRPALTIVPALPSDPVDLDGLVRVTRALMG